MKLLIGLALCLIALENSSAQVYSQGVDLTLVPRASGPDVVRAVLAKIDASGVFGDSSIANVFMRRLAYVESRDGQATSYPDGGIWNVSQTTFSYTQTMYSNLIPNIYNGINTHFGFNWLTEVQYNNLTKPIYSGLAVRLQLYYLDNSLFLIIPSRQLQDDYWINHILRRPRSILTMEREELRDQWNDAVQEIEQAEACRIEADVVFVLDASGSIGAVNFDRVRNYTYSFADALIEDTDNHQNRIGVVLYSSGATVEIDLNSTLNQFQNKADLLQAIRNLPYLTGGTNTPEGLCKLAAQPWRSGLVLRLGIVLTDGQSNRRSLECGDLTQAAGRAKDQSLLIYALGVGGGVDTDELQLIASGPHFVDHVDSFTEGLETAEDVRSYEICFTANQPIDIGDVSLETSGEGQTTRLSLRSPQEEGVTIRICMLSGQVILYASRSVPNPSAALHDWSEIVRATNQSVNCLTEFFSLAADKRRRRQTNNDVPLYVSIEGVDTNNEFTFNSSVGNVTFDVNECEQKQPPCPEYSSCYNTDGSFYCQCISGFQMNEAECIDTNECEEDTSLCDPNASCQNTLGGFNCTCFLGFSGNGTNCEDFNECEQDLNPCSLFKVCNNTHGGYTCTVNNYLVTITTVLTAGPLLLIVLVTTIAVILCLCYKKKAAPSKKDHAVSYSTENEAVSSSADMQSEKKKKTKLKEPFQADKKTKSFSELESDDESEEEWNYTMTITWEQDDEEIKRAYI